jgi:hypothetical protein
MDARSQGRVLPLFASVARPVSNATACRYSQLRRSLTQRAVDSWAIRFPPIAPVNSHLRFTPIRRRKNTGLAVNPR